MGRNFHPFPVPTRRVTSLPGIDFHFITGKKGKSLLNPSLRLSPNTILFKRILIPAMIIDVKKASRIDFGATIDRYVHTYTHTVHELHIIHNCIRSWFRIRRSINTMEFQWLYSIAFSVSLSSFSSSSSHKQIRGCNLQGLSLVVSSLIS